jgi:hypothetical protein
VQSLVLHHLRRYAHVRPRLKQIAFDEMNQRVFRAAKRRRCFSNLIENRLKAHTRPSQVLKHVGHGLMTITKLAQLPHELDDPGIVRPDIRHCPVTLWDDATD